MRIEYIGKLGLVILIVLISFCVVFSQANHGDSNPNKKANKRPGKESSKKKKPEFAVVNSENSPEIDDEILTVETRLVTLPVRVLDRQGRFVSGLKKNDFSVFEEKVSQQIEYFSNEQSPFTVALVLDMSYSSTFKINEIQQAALTFITELRPSDKVMIISFDGEINVLSGPTSDRTKLQQAIIKTSIGSGTSLYEAVDFALNKMLRSIEGRKAVVLFTDGVDTTSRATSDLENLSDALEYDALIYPIRYDTYADVKAIEDGKVRINLPDVQATPPIGGGRIPIGQKKPGPIPAVTIGGRRGSQSRIPGSGTTKEEYVFAERYLDELAARTGGRVFQANNSARLASAFSKIANELREYYSIGYYPKTETKKQRRKIKVRVDRKNVAIRTRGSYVLSKKRRENDN